jgi:hypothetical protein
VPYLRLYPRNLLLSEQEITFTYAHDMLIRPPSNHDPARGVGVIA